MLRGLNRPFRYSGDWSFKVLHINFNFNFRLTAAVISINKKLVKKKRGECVTFEGEHYYQTNGTFVWKKRETTTMVSGGRIRISGDRGNTVEIRQLEESDTAMYSAMIHTAGGLEITRHWLVVRGTYFTFSSTEPTILLACGRDRGLVKVVVDPRGDSRVVPQTTLTMLWRNSLSIAGQTLEKR